MGRKEFCGEVWTNVHPQILQALSDANLVDVDGKVGKGRIYLFNL